MKVLESEVLVIGAGGAGLRAAIAAFDQLPEGRIVLATKGKVGQSGVTATACSDRMAFHATLPHTEPSGREAWRHHAEDVYRIGGEVSDWSLAEILARRSTEAFRYLSELGVPFVIRDGRADQFLTDGSRYARACYTGPYTANDIEQALVRRLHETRVQVLEECVAADLLIRNGRAVGVMAAVQGELAEIHARAIVLATGGAGGGWAINVFPDGMTGDGYAMAYRAGCALVNMEFIQIGLCSTRTKLACSGSMMRALPRVVNDLGEEFLPRYNPGDQDRASIYDLLFAKGATWPVSFEHRCHRIDVAIFRELRAGRRVFLDYSRNPERLDLAGLDQSLLARFPNVAAFYSLATASESPLTRLLAINRPSVDWLAARGIDLAGGDPLEIAPAVQHFQGGVKIDYRAATSLSGLYAAGECSGGQHGANRPGGHSLLDGQVFGRIAGESAAQEARSLDSWVPPDAVSRELAASRLERMNPKENRQGVPAAEARSEIRSLLSQVASVVRSPAALEQGLRDIATLRLRGVVVDSEGLEFCLETQNLLQVAEIVLLAASARRESRGPHLFFDSPEGLEPLPHDDQNGNRYIVVQMGPDGRPRASRATPVRPHAVIGE